MNKKHLWTVVLIGVVLLGVLFVYRGRGGQNPQSASQPDNSLTQPSFAQSEPISVGNAEEAPAINSLEWPKVLTFGTAGTGGAYYPIGVAIGGLFEKFLPSKVTVEITGGAIENPVLMSKGELDVALTNEHLGYFGLNQMAPFENLTQPKFSALSAGLQPGVVHFAVMKGSSIQSPADLKGKVIAVGTQGNGSLSTIRAILEFYGVGWNDFSQSYMNYSEGCQALIDGTVDCSIVPAGVPVSSIQELSVSGKAYRLLDMPDREKFLETSPFYTAVDLPANTYEGQKDVVHTLATANIIIVRSDLDEDIVYYLTKTLYENIEDIYQAVPGLRGLLTLENAHNTVVPIHSGAQKYYREAGVIF